MNLALIVLLVTVGFAAAIIIGLIVYLTRRKKMLRDTQREVSDRELLRIIQGKIDGFVTAQEVADETTLNKAEAKSRLLALAYTGILRTSMQGFSNYHFELTNPNKEIDPPALSPEPFLTADDILQLFKSYDYRLDFQDLIVATGLPLSILEREMKYFVKEKMIKPMNKYMGYGARPYRFFLLEEPYRSNPDQFLQNEEKVDLKLRELLKNDQLI